MREIRARCAWRRAAVVAGAAAVVGVTGAAAQERVESDCRCVDEAGEQIKRCVCVVRPEFPARRRCAMRTMHAGSSEVTKWRRS